MKESRLTRREFVKRSSLGLAGAAAIGPFFGFKNVFAARDKGNVVVAVGSGSFQKAVVEAYVKPFTEATGIKVQIHNRPALAQKRALMESGRITVDVWGGQASDVIAMVPHDWIEPIDYGYFRQEDLDHMPQQAKGKYHVPFIYWAEIMALRTDIFPENNRPRCWADFWDSERFPGPRCMGDPGYTYGLEFALLADGVPLNKLYPLDLDRAFKSLSKIRDDVIAWWGKSPALAAQLINDKEVFLTSSSNGRAQEPIDDGAPVAIEWNEGMLYDTGWSVAKGGPNTENAMKFIAFTLQPRPQGVLANHIPFGPVNTKAYDFVDPKIAKNLPTYKDHLDKLFYKNYDWWFTADAEGKTNREVVIDRWENWKIGR